MFIARRQKKNDARDVPAQRPITQRHACCATFLRRDVCLYLLACVWTHHKTDLRLTASLTDHWQTISTIGLLDSLEQGLPFLAESAPGRDKRSRGANHQSGHGSRFVAVAKKNDKRCFIFQLIALSTGLLISGSGLLVWHTPAAPALIATSLLLGSMWRNARSWDKNNNIFYL